MECLTIATPDELNEQDGKHLVNFQTFVKKAGEATATHVDSAKCVVQFFSSGKKLVGTAALKTDRDYRRSFFRRAGVEELLDRFPLELGYVVVDENLRGRGLSYLLVTAALSRREKSNVCATSNMTNLAMHSVLKKQGFIRAGVPWKSETKPDQYLTLFLLS
jgi:GNAT superfamily N-acetyltransferase